MSFTSERMDKITTVGKKRHKTELKVLTVIANNENVDLEMIMKEAKLSIKEELLIRYEKSFL